MSVTQPITTAPSFCALGVFDAVIENDLPMLKRCLKAFPDCLTHESDEGNNILHLSIILEQFEIFDYLLSLNETDLEACTRNGDVALTLCLVDDHDTTEYFAQELIKKGADVHYKCGGDTLLHLAARKHKFHVARLLIEKGVDINAQNINGCTPLHMVFHMKTNPDGVNEGVALMMYYGADASIADNNGNIPFELAILYDRRITTVQENLLYYTFNAISEYKMSVEVLYELLETQSVLLPKIAQYVTDVIFVKGVFFAPLYLFSLQPEILVVMIEKFDCVIKELFSGPLVTEYDVLTVSLQNWEILMNSHLASDTVNFIGKLSIHCLIERLHEEEVPPQKIISLIFYLLTYGINVYDKDLDTVYKKYGYCDLFKTLLFMDIQTSLFETYDIVPRVIYDLNLDLEEFLNNPDGYSLNGIERLLDNFARPKIKELCVKLGIERLITKAKQLPRVPLLQELARDATRKFLVNRYDITKTKEFFSVLKWLPISIFHGKILALETKLYR